MTGSFHVGACCFPNAKSRFFPGGRRALKRIGFTYRRTLTEHKTYQDRSRMAQEAQAIDGAERADTVYGDNRGNQEYRYLDIEAPCSPDKSRYIGTVRKGNIFSLARCCSSMINRNFFIYFRNDCAGESEDRLSLICR